jgi:glycosyltransferase involved in cell wall biosynthesis
MRGGVSLSLPLISVVMPVRNGRNYILEAVRSVLCQTYKWFELVIYDDGSTDGTREVLKTIKDGRIRIIEGDTGKGVAAARNVLLENVKGEFVAHQDADDISYPDRLERLWKYLVAEDLIFTCCSNRILGSEHVFEFCQDRKAAPKMQWECQKAFAGNNCMYRRAVVDAGIRYDERLLYGEDVLFEAEIQAMFPYKMEAVKEILYLYRKHYGGLIVKRKKGEVIVPEEVILERNQKIKDMLQSFIDDGVL